MPRLDLPRSEPAKGGRLEPAKGPAGTQLSSKGAPAGTALPPPAHLRAGVSQALGQAQQRMRGCRVEGASGSVPELRKVPPHPRCCGGG